MFKKIKEATTISKSFLRNLNTKQKNKIIRIQIKVFHCYAHPEMYFNKCDSTAVSGITLFRRISYSLSANKCNASCSYLGIPTTNMYLNVVGNLSKH